jgi:hypothetical protein
MKDEKRPYTELVLRAEKTQCVVFDLDATLCDHDTQTSYEDCDLFYPIPAMLELAKMVKAHEYDVVIATARPSTSYDKTIVWLNKYLPEFDALYMANAKVRAIASLVKEQQLLKIEEKWDILFWADDSPFNAEVIRDHAVTCLRPTANDAFWASYGNS